ncbi:MAG: hypothetical protein AAFP03_19285, partial [Cyanobacteria bacterium J06598_3]
MQPSSTVGDGPKECSEDDETSLSPYIEKKLSLEYIKRAVGIVEDKENIVGFIDRGESLNLDKK